MFTPAFERLETRSMMSAADSAPTARSFAPDLEADGSGWTSVYKDDDGEVFVRS